MYAVIMQTTVPWTDQLHILHKYRPQPSGKPMGILINLLERLLLNRKRSTMFPLMLAQCRNWTGRGLNTFNVVIIRCSYIMDKILEYPQLKKNIKPSAGQMLGVKLR